MNRLISFLPNSYFSVLFCFLPLSIWGQDIQLIAHRGGVVEGKHSENSIAALEEAIRRGYGMVEVDIRESQDGRIVVHHDADFKRFYGVERKLSEMKWEEIKRLTTEKEKERPLLFEEFAALCKGKIQLMLDTKPPAHSPAFYQKLESYLRENDLLKQAYVIGTKESRAFFKGKARVGISFLDLIKAKEAGESVEDLYFLFMHGNDLLPYHIQTANSLNVPVVPSVNLFHYRLEDPLKGGRRDIEWLKGLGVSQFQIDSDYDKWLLEKPAPSNDEYSMKIMTFNIRYPNPEDGENYWPKRKELVASMIRYHGADMVGIQEAFRSQLDELMEMLPGFSWLGVCRTSGNKNPKPDNEFSAILYRNSRFRPQREGTFWLSETPDEVGVAGWDAALPRIVTWAQFQDLASGKDFFHFNTHFDHRGKEARKNSAGLLLDKIKEFAGSDPVIITGDFNALPNSPPYQVLVTSEEDRRVEDAYFISETPHHGPDGTGTKGFKIPGVTGGRIDYIFRKNGVRILSHAILSDSWGGRLPSDHLPVLVECVIP